MKNMSLKVKLIGGFSVVLLFLVLIAGKSFLTINQASDGFTQYRGLAPGHQPGRGACSPTC